MDGSVRVLTKIKDVVKLMEASDEIKLNILSKYALMAKMIDKKDAYNNIHLLEHLMSGNVARWAITEKGSHVYNQALTLDEGKYLNNLLSTEESMIDLLSKLANTNHMKFRDFSSFDDVVKGLKKFDEANTNNNKSDNLDDILILDETGLDNYLDDDIVIIDDINNPVGNKPKFEPELDDEYIDGYDEYDYDGEINTNIEVDTKDNINKNKKDSRYNENMHGGYRKQIEGLILTAWKDLYGNHVDGREVINGFIVPGGAILSKGEQYKYEGILKLGVGEPKVEHSIMSNIIYEEFIEACKDCDINIIKTVSDKVSDVSAFKYNPMLQRMIASGVIDKERYKDGWDSYEKAIMPYISDKAKDLAIIKSETGSDKETYRALSGYIISLVVLNYKDNLGTQLRICCGDTSKTELVAIKLVQRLRVREKSDKSMAQGKALIGDAIVSDSGFSATLSIYTNIEGYQAVPQFMGELLCSLQEGMFKPSLKNIIIGVDLKNNIVTAPFTKWLLPIIAGSRSGKGVLTLNMLLSVVGVGAPLFYLDGKPDMASLLWKLQERYGIVNSMVIDGVNYQGTTEIDMKPYRAPYANNLEKMMRSVTADEMLENNFGVMIYLKTMLVLILSTRYYKDIMGSPYGDLFVVFDELYMVMKSQIEILVLNIDTEIAKLNKEDEDRKSELRRIRLWVHELLNTFTGSDIGVFGAGIKAVALAQFAQSGQYNVSSFAPAKTFCTNFLLKREVKLFGRQSGGSGKYGVVRGKDDDIVFDLYDKYYHFGIGVEEGNDFNSLKTFKPFLVLNENDCMELTGASEDGAFTRDMLHRVSQYTDINRFREKYFTDERLAKSIGFEGALSEVGRLVGEDWRVMLDNSLSRAYEIADGALRYFGIIGIDNIESVYDYICSFENTHLWSYNEILKAKRKGIGLNGENIDILGEDYDYDIVEDGYGVDGDSMFSDIDLDSTPDGLDNYSMDETSNSFSDNIGLGGKLGKNKSLFGGNTVDLSKNDLEILEDIESRKQAQVGIIDDGLNDMEPDSIDSMHSTDGIDSTDITDEDIEGLVELQRVMELEGDGEHVFKVGGRTGKNMSIKPTSNTKVVRLSPENSIIVEMNNKHPLELYESRLLKTLKGTNYELDKRWDLILKSISNRINPNLITRVILIQDEMYVNNRLVSTLNVLGGFENIRLEDVVEFRKMFKRFNNINEMTIDTIMVERFSMEQSDLPRGFFNYSSKLRKVNILLSDGTKEVIDRNSINEQMRKEMSATDRARINNKFDVVCASKNPNFKNKDSVYKSRIWDSTKSFGSKNWDSITHHLSKENPSFVKATALGALTIGVVAVGGLVHGIGGLFNMFKR